MKRILIKDCCISNVSNDPTALTRSAGILALGVQRPTITNNQIYGCDIAISLLASGAKGATVFGDG